MTRGLAAGLLVLALVPAACGRYGAPVRSAPGAPGAAVTPEPPEPLPEAPEEGEEPEP